MANYSTSQLLLQYITCTAFLSGKSFRDKLRKCLRHATVQWVCLHASVAVPCICFRLWTRRTVLLTRISHAVFAQILDHLKAFFMSLWHIFNSCFLFGVKLCVTFLVWCCICPRKKFLHKQVLLEFVYNTHWTHKMHIHENWQSIVSYHTWLIYDAFVKIAYLYHFDTPVCLHPSVLLSGGFPQPTPPVKYIASKLTKP